MDEDVTVLQSAVGHSMETRIIGGASPGASSAASWNPALRATATSVLHSEVRWVAPVISALAESTHALLKPACCISNDARALKVAPVASQQHVSRRFQLEQKDFSLSMKLAVWKIFGLQEKFDAEAAGYCSAAQLLAERDAERAAAGAAAGTRRLAQVRGLCWLFEACKALYRRVQRQL